MFGYIYDWPGVILYRGFVVEEFSTQLVSKLGTCLLTIACCCVMGRILVFQLLLWVVPWFWVSPSLGGEPYSWRRPVPGWRQSKESVTLENRGYHFEEAEFEAHFRDQGKEN